MGHGRRKIMLLQFVVIVMRFYRVAGAATGRTEAAARMIALQIARVAVHLNGQFRQFRRNETGGMFIRDKESCAPTVGNHHPNVFGPHHQRLSTGVAATGAVLAAPSTVEDSFAADRDRTTTNAAPSKTRRMAYHSNECDEAVCALMIFLRKNATRGFYTDTNAERSIDMSQ
jgi:hypothetical protein